MALRMASSETSFMTATDGLAAISPQESRGHRGGTEMSQTNDCLCHGRGGNCETLIYGAQILGRPEWLHRAEEIGLQEIETCAAQRTPWPCGTYGAVEVPGLLLGLAGIGYFYLRLADPAGTPTVLIPLC